MKILRAGLFFGLAALALCADQQDWKNLRQQIKQTLHVPDQLDAPGAKSYGKFSPAPGVEAERVSYATGYNLRVPAIVYRPAGVTIVKHPALIVVNGHGGDKSSWYAAWAGILYARAGAVVVTYDPIGEFERNSERQSNTGQHDTFIAPDDMARRLAGLMVTDIMQAVSYLDSRKDVDPKRIGVMGYSMGSFISSIACSVDTRVHACVLVGGGDLDGPNGYWDSSGKKMCQAIPYKSLDFLGDRGALLFALSARRGPTLIWNGTADNVVDIGHHGQDFFADLRKRTIAELGNSKDVFDFGFTPDGGHWPYFLTRPVALWLEDKLKFPDWTKKEIEALPESRQQGGVMAIGNQIPAVPRDSLLAIPDAVWDSERESFVYETWVGRAQTAVRSSAP